MPAPTITPLPDAPLRSEAPTTFTTKAETFVDALADLPTEINAFGTYLDSLGLDPADIPSAATDLEMSTARILGRTTASTGAVEELTAAQVNAFLDAKLTESIIIACSDETTALTTGTAKVTLRMPYAFTVTGVRASLTTAQTSGSIFTVDINESGTTILSTKLTIDNTEKTSTTAASAAVISDASLADDAEITIDIDQVGDGTAKGLKVYLIGQRA